MIIVVVISMSISIALLYQAAFDQTEARLIEIVHNRARLIESIAKFSSEFPSGYPGNTLELTIYQLKKAQENFNGFGKTGEFTLAHLVDNQMVFLINQRFQTTKLPSPIPLDSELAEPMRRSLTGKIGTVIGQDYRGETVLAAYEPVKSLNLGIVAKIDLSEIRSPFIKAVFYAGGAATILILLGAFTFVKVTNPILENLEENELRIRSTFEQAAVGITHSTMQRNILDVNEKFCELTGYTKKELLNKNLNDITFQRDKEVEKEAIERVLNSDENCYSLEKRYVKKNGDVSWAKVTVSLVKDIKNNPKYFIAIVEDINSRKKYETALKQYSGKLEEMVNDRTKELKETQERLIRQEKLAALGQLAGGVGHELRNPLGIMTNAILYLQTNEDNTNEELSEYLEIISRQVKISSKIISDLLEFGMHKSSQKTLFRAEKTIAEIISNIQKPDTVLINQSAEYDLPDVFADEEHFRMIAHNIISNACQSIREEGVVTISLSRSGSSVILKVQDTGCGMDEDTISKIYEPLFTTKTRGIGLGMAITQNLAEINNIKIEVESKLNIGTTFTMSIPLKESSFVEKV